MDDANTCQSQHHGLGNSDGGWWNSWTDGDEEKMLKADLCMQINKSLCC